MHLMCTVFALVAMTSCDGFEVNWGNGGNGDNEEDVVSVELARCWHLVSFCGVEAEADIYIDLGKDGISVPRSWNIRCSTAPIRPTRRIRCCRAFIAMAKRGQAATTTPWIRRQRR